MDKFYDETQAEIRMALADDDTRIGDVWRGLENEQTPEQIASSLGMQTSNLGKHCYRTNGAQS